MQGSDVIIKEGVTSEFGRKIQFDEPLKGFIVSVVGERAEVYIPEIEEILVYSLKNISRGKRKKFSIKITPNYSMQIKR